MNITRIKMKVIRGVNQSALSAANHRDEVSKLAVGPSGTYICSDCVQLCNIIIRDENIDTNIKNKSDSQPDYVSMPSSDELPKPTDIKKFAQISML